MNKHLLMIQEIGKQALVKSEMYGNTDKVASYTKMLSVRNVAPQYTKKRIVVNGGLNFVGLKNILILLGYDSSLVEDVLDAYEGELEFISTLEDGSFNLESKRTTYLEENEIEKVIDEILILLEENYIKRKTNATLILGIMNRLVSEKVNYILNKESKSKTPKQLAENIIDKYNNRKDNLFYGYQQQEIAKELSTVLGERKSFAQWLRHFNIEYKWSKETRPYNIVWGKEWLVCKILNN